MRCGNWIVLIILASVAPSYAANEARCATLGANCICSEPMNTATWVDRSGGQFFDPADTTVSDKQCSSSGVAVGAAYESGSGFTLVPTNSGEAITNLPAAHTNTWVLATPSNGAGGQAFGGKDAGGTPTARKAIRFYQYYSTNYSFVGENGGACLNSNKVAQLGWNGALTGGPIFTITAGTWSFYAVEISTNWNQNGNGCCAGPGPGATGAGPSLAAAKGKWFRYEIVIHNSATTGAPTTFDWFIKNITDNTAEVQVVNSAVATTMPDSVNWTTALATTLHPTNTINELSIDMFRNGTCTGFAAYTHYLSAAWATDAAQRIGAATEIEGSGTDTTPPAAPTGVTIAHYGAHE